MFHNNYVNIVHSKTALKEYSNIVILLLENSFNVYA